MKTRNIQEMMEGSQARICVFHQACLSAAHSVIYVTAERKTKKKKTQQKIIADRYTQKMRFSEIPVV